MSLLFSQSLISWKPIAMFVLFLAADVLFTSMSFVSGHCPAMWNASDTGTCYRCISFGNHVKSIIDASDKCKAINGSLAQLRFPSDFHLAQELLTREVEENPNYPKDQLDDFIAYVGGSDILKENDFRWLDGTKIDANFWAENEPNNLDDKGEDCVLFGTLKGYGSGALYDIVCCISFDYRRIYSVLCQLDPQSISRDDVFRMKCLSDFIPLQRKYMYNTSINLLGTWPQVSQESANASGTTRESNKTSETIAGLTEKTGTPLQMASPTGTLETTADATDVGISSDVTVAPTSTLEVTGEATGITTTSETTMAASNTQEATTAHSNTLKMTTEATGVTKTSETTVAVTSTLKKTGSTIGITNTPGTTTAHTRFKMTTGATGTARTSNATREGASVNNSTRESSQELTTVAQDETIHTTESIMSTTSARENSLALTTTYKSFVLNKSVPGLKYTSCRCRKIANYTVSRGLGIVKTNLSSYKRTKYSAPDDRVSCRLLGVIGIALVVCVGLVILALDFNRIRRDIKNAWNRRSISI